MPPYHILAIDGGGIRGLLSAILLERLEAAVPGFLSKIDLFAGTSTGGILALGLAAGVTPTQARALYEEKGPEVFAENLFDNVRDLGHAIGAQYGNSNLKRVLGEYFGDKTLGDLTRKVLISSFDLDNGPDNPAALRRVRSQSNRTGCPRAARESKDAPAQDEGYSFLPQHQRPSS